MRFVSSVPVYHRCVFDVCQFSVLVENTGLLAYKPEIGRTMTSPINSNSSFCKLWSWVTLSFWGLGWGSFSYLYSDVSNFCKTEHTNVLPLKSNCSCSSSFKKALAAMLLNAGVLCSIRKERAGQQEVPWFFSRFRQFVWFDVSQCIFVKKSSRMSNLISFIFVWNNTIIFNCAIFSKPAIFFLAEEGKNKELSINLRNEDC